MKKILFLCAAIFMVGSAWAQKSDDARDDRDLLLRSLGEPDLGFKVVLNKKQKTTSPTAVCYNDVYVNDATGNDANAGDTPATAKLTIQAGIDAVCDGGTVHVYPGSYSEAATGRFVLGVNGPHQFGLFVDKDNVTIQGVDGSGTPITDYNSVLAEVATNATNNFGYSGIFVQGDGVTIQGLKILGNTAGDNKTFEIIGDAFTLKYCDITPGYSVYFDDWQFDTGTNTSHVQSYTIEGNVLRLGGSIDLASGAGFSGPVSGRVIKDNKFEEDPSGQYWPFISFNGSGTGVPWFVYSVGGAVITGNDFSNNYNTVSLTAAHIRARGTYDNTQFDWTSYWNDNTFNKAVITLIGAYPPFDVRTYSYPNAYGTFNDVRRIGLTIQGEINNAVAGDNVLVASGTYTEQVTVTKSLNLIGAGAVTTTIKAPSTIPVASNPASTVIDINGSGVTVDIGGFTVSGPGPTGCGSIGTGIFVRGGAHADIHDNKILDIRDNPISGCQNGVGIQVGRNLYSTTGTATIKNNEISGYQKNGITVDNTGSYAEISDNTITGAGAVTFIAQNGIQISRGATGDIKNNTVQGHSYTPFTAISTGMLFYQADANTDDNDVLENQIGIYHINGSGTHKLNNVSASGAGTGSPSFWGIVVDPAGIPRAKPSPLDEETSTLGKSSVTSQLTATYTTMVDQNTITGDGVTANCVGLEMDALGTDVLNVTATKNTITKWDYGVYLYKDVGATLNANIIDCNQIYDNMSYGAYNSTGVTANAVGNWWGAASGPTHVSNPSGTGDVISDDLTFAPWGATASCGGLLSNNFVFLANECITITRAKQSASMGNMHSNNLIYFLRGDPNKFTGDLTAVGNIKIDKEIKIIGDATAGGKITLGEHSSITGTKTSYATVAAIPLPTPAGCTPSGTNRTVKKDGSLTLPPGSYGKVIVGDYAKLKLSAGNYCFAVLETKTESVLQINVAGGPVNITVMTSLKLGKELEMQVSSGEAGSSAITFNALQSTKVLIDQGSYVLGSFIAPNAEVVLAKNVSFRGSICAKKITVERDVVFLHHTSPGSLPKPEFEGNKEISNAQAPVTTYELEQNYPNPFNPSTTISFALLQAGEVNLAIYNIYGQLVRQLVAGQMTAGRHSVIWNGKDERGQQVASGMYLYVLKAGDFTAQRKLVLMK